MVVVVAITDIIVNFMHKLAIKIVKDLVRTNVHISFNCDGDF